MANVFATTTVLIFISASVLAATPEEFSFQRGRPSAVPVDPKAPPASLKVPPPPPPATPAPAAEPGSTQVFNRFRFDGNHPIAIKLKPAPKGCGFYRGNFGIRECSRIKKQDGTHGMFCKAAYVNPDDGGITGFVARNWPWSDQGKAVPFNFEVTNPAIEAFLCSKQNNMALRASFKGAGKAIENLEISEGLNLCDPSGQLYGARGKEDSRYKHKQFQRVAGLMSIEALKSRADRFVQKKGQSAEQILADCVANVRVAPARPNPAQLPVEPKRPEVKAPARPEGKIAPPPPPPPPPAPKAPAAPKKQLPAPLPLPTEPGRE